MSICRNLFNLRKNIPQHVKLVAVSKTQPTDIIYDAYKCGQKIFGENKAQDLAIKHPILPNDIEWHFIGHLQTNKVKYIAPFVTLIHSIDSFKLLTEINKEAIHNKRIINCLLQFHISKEETKFGLDIQEAKELLSYPELANLKNVNICGVMGIASFTHDKDMVRDEFRGLKAIFDDLKNEYFADHADFKEVSMGMSDDYHIAIEEGSTIVRLGSLIFGERKY